MWLKNENESYFVRDTRRSEAKRASEMTNVSENEAAVKRTEFKSSDQQKQWNIRKMCNTILHLV